MLEVSSAPSTPWMVMADVLHVQAHDHDSTSFMFWPYRLLNGGDLSARYAAECIMKQGHASW